MNNTYQHRMDGWMKSKRQTKDKEKTIMIEMDCEEEKTQRRKTETILHRTKSDNRIKRANKSGERKTLFLFFENTVKQIGHSDNIVHTSN